MFDGLSRDFVGAVATRPGQRCLHLGAGNGSLTRWMAERIGPTDSVHAVDVDTTHLDAPGVHVHRSDINDGLPDEGPFDLIHARLLLIHLERRREIPIEPVDALAPDGRLVLGEFTHPLTMLLAAPPRPTPNSSRRWWRPGSRRWGGPPGRTTPGATGSTRRWSRRD